MRSEEWLESVEILTSDLLYKLDPGHCYTLITDPLYYDILQPKLFQEMVRSTYFVIRVKFNQDMITPKNETMATLREAYRAGCRCYLIYLANGIQMNRFLRFIDRFVVLRNWIAILALYFSPNCFFVQRKSNQSASKAHHSSRLSFVWYSNALYLETVC